MDLNLKNELNKLTDKIRTAMNSAIPEIQNNFEGWCELASMTLYRVIREYLPDLENNLIEGTFNGLGHFWNVIDNTIVDITIDQFGNYNVGVIDNKDVLALYVEKDIIEPDEYDLINITDDVYDYLKLN